jgi:hypothetical protein
MGTTAHVDAAPEWQPEADLLGGLDEAPRQAAPSLRLLVDLIRKRALGLAFVGGVMLGWLAIGWWLWPVQWANSGPWDLAAPYQERYVALVAAQFYRDGDALQARRDLAGWRPEALAAVLSTMMKEAPTGEARQELAALQNALALQDAAEPPLWLALLRQTSVYWSAGLAIVLLTAALALAVVPPRWVPHLAAAEGAEGQAGPQALAAAPGRGPLEPWLEAFEEAAEEVSTAADSTEAQGEEEGEPAQQEGKPAARPVERVFLNAERPEGHPAEKEEKEETGSLLADLLAGEELLDQRLEVLSTMVEDVPVDGLARQARRVLAQLRGVELGLLGAGES